MIHYISAFNHLLKLRDMCYEFGWVVYLDYPKCFLTSSLPGKSMVVFNGTVGFIESPGNGIISPHHPSSGNMGNSHTLETSFIDMIFNNDNNTINTFDLYSAFQTQGHFTMWHTSKITQDQQTYGGGAGLKTWVLRRVLKVARDEGFRMSVGREFQRVGGCHTEGSVARGSEPGAGG